MFCLCVGATIKRPTTDELMDPNGHYSRRQVDVSIYSLYAHRELYDMKR